MNCAPLAACQMAAIRGPKKKGKGGPSSDGPENPDIVNIFKGREDCKIYPSDMYPPFLMGMIRPRYTADDVMLQMYRGERIPDAKEQWALFKQIKRNNIKDYNSLRHHDWEYESEDEVGEDTGGVAGRKSRDNDDYGEEGDSDEETDSDDE